MGREVEGILWSSDRKAFLVRGEEISLEFLGKDRLGGLFSLFIDVIFG